MVHRIIHAVKKFFGHKGEEECKGCKPMAKHASKKKGKRK